MAPLIFRHWFGNVGGIFHRKKLETRPGRSGSKSSTNFSRKKDTRTDQPHFAFHVFGSVMVVTVLLTAATGLPRNFVNARLAFSWYYCIDALIRVSKHATHIAPDSFVAWVRKDLKWMVPASIRVLLAFAGVFSGAWAAAWCVPHEVLTTTATKLLVTVMLLTLSFVLVWRRNGHVKDPLSVLRALKTISACLLLWTAVLWVDNSLNASGIAMSYMTPADPSLKVCTVYVTTFKGSPRLDDLVPAMRDNIRGLDGAQWYVYNGTKMPKSLEKRRSDMIIRNLVEEGYLSESSLEEVPCTRGLDDETCLRPDARFDQRVTNLGAAMGHIRILERFIKDHVEEPNCVALILEDDAILDEGFAATLKQEIQSMPSGWDVASLEGSNKVCHWGVWQNEGLNPWHHIKLSDHYTYTPPLSWAGAYTGGYLVTTRGAMRILNELPMTSNIDTWLNKLAFLNKITMYIRCPELMVQGSAAGVVKSETARGGPKHERGSFIDVPGTPASTPIVKHDEWQA